MKDFKKFSLMEESETSTSDHTIPARESILHNHGNAYEYQWNLDVCPYETALKAMDEYARSLSVGFAEWISSWYVHYFKDDNYVWVEYRFEKYPEGAPENFTTEQLYEKFINRKNPTPQGLK